MLPVIRKITYHSSGGLLLRPLGHLPEQGEGDEGLLMIEEAVERV
jgi:hypothetical protein